MDSPTLASGYQNGIESAPGTAALPAFIGVVSPVLWPTLSINLPFQDQFITL